MKFKILATAAVLVFGSTTALAGDNNGPKFGGTDYEQTQGQGQTANAGAAAGAVGIGLGTGGEAKATQGQIGINKNTNLVGGGSAAQSQRNYSGSDSTSSVGDTLSQSGAVSGGNEVGQDVNVDASDQSVTDVSYNTDYPVSTAASLFTQVCQQGVSGQGKDWGASAVFSDPLCDEIKVAQFYWIAHINEHEHGNEEQAADFKEKYVAQMEDIEKMMDATDELGIVDRASGFLLKPLGVIALLVFLL